MLDVLSLTALEGMLRVNEHRIPKYWCSEGTPVVSVIQGVIPKSLQLLEKVTKANVTRREGMRSRVRVYKCVYEIGVVVVVVVVVLVVFVCLHGSWNHVTDGEER